jgi:hypothetical protein
VATILRPAGEGGVSMISSAAGRNASSSPRLSGERRNGTTARACLLDMAASVDKEPSLDAVQRGVAAVGLDQRVMRAILDHAATLERDNAIRSPHG